MRYQWLIGPLLAAAILGFAFGGCVAWGIMYVPPQQHAADNHQPDQNPAETEHKSGEQAQSLWIPTDSVGLYTLVLAVFTGLLVAVSGAQGAFLIRTDRTARTAAQAAEKSAEAAERSIIATTRPWIKINIAVGGPIQWSANEVRFTLIYILQNTGNSPALNVHVHSQVFDYAMGGMFGALTKHIDLMKQFNPPASIGYAIFPGETIETKHMMGMSKEQIEAATKALPAIYPAVVGSVVYRIGSEKLIHQTGFAVEIRRDDSPRPFTTQRNYAPSAIWIEEGDVPASEIRLYRSYIEGGYAD